MKWQRKYNYHVYLLAALVAAVWGWLGFIIYTGLTS